MSTSSFCVDGFARNGWPVRTKNSWVSCWSTKPDRNTTGDTPGNHLFNDWSYLFCLYGKGYFDGIEFPAEGSVNRADWSEYTRQLDAAKHRLVQGLPSHRDLMTAIRREPAPAGRSGTVGLPGAALRPVISSGTNN